MRQDRVEIEATGKWTLHQDPVHSRIGGQTRHEVFDLGLGCGGGKGLVTRDHPRFLGLTMLVAHIHLGGTVITDEHCRQTHRRRTCSLDLGAQTGHDAISERVAVHQDRSRGGPGCGGVRGGAHSIDGTTWE